MADASVDQHSNASSESEYGNEEEWSDWEEDESEAVKSLFSSDSFPTVEVALQFDAQNNGFDLLQFISENKIASEYDIFKVINYIRTEVAAGRDPRPTLTSTTNASSPWDDDSYLTPALPDDGLLLHDWDLSWDEQEEAAKAPLPSEDDAARLVAENQALRAALDALQSLALQEPQALQELSEERRQSAGATGAGAPSTSAGTKGFSSLPPPEATLPAISARVDAAYFDSYSSFDIHRQMLADQERTLAYREALEHNPSLIKGAKVLDVGCGTGVLSMFAARGGAAAVVGVDGSDKMAEIARLNCTANNLDGTVSVVAGRVESFEELPGVDGPVDVLVSEWMGYALLFEAMLDSVLYARDKFLKPGGAVLPDVARIYMAAGTAGATGLDFWDNVYGLTMSPISEKLRRSALQEAVVRVVDPQHIITPSFLIQSFDLATMTSEDQDFNAAFELVPKQGDAVQECHALVLWFDVLFSERFCIDRAVDLSTSFDLPPTHWAQTVLVLPSPIMLGPAGGAGPAGQEVAVSFSGRVSMARREGAHRCLDISVEYAPTYADGKKGDTVVQIYAMGVMGGD